MKRYLLILLAILLLGCSNAKSSAPVSAGEAPTPEPVPASPEQVLPAGDAVLEKLEIVSKPVKMSYVTGETFEPEGLVINAIYSDGGVLENVEWTVETPLISPRMTAVTLQCMGKTLRLSIDVIIAGNAPEYSVEQTPVLDDSPIKGQTFFWLGSSVTYGSGSDGESVPDFFGKKYEVITIKEAVPGTTLSDSKPNSYVDRLNKYLAGKEKADHVDLFICQLSTNDTSLVDQRGILLPDFITASDAFDTKTTCGAIEYIIAVAKETWDCPIYFYTNPPTGNGNYRDLVEMLFRVAEKWDITVIDLYTDEDFNAITDEQRTLYLSDPIHPTKAGYREWWLPKFEEALLP